MRLEKLQAWTAHLLGNNLTYWIGDCYGKPIFEKIKHFKTWQQERKFFRNLERNLTRQGWRRYRWDSGDIHLFQKPD